MSSNWHKHRYDAIHSLLLCMNSRAFIVNAFGGCLSLECSDNVNPMIICIKSPSTMIIKQTTTKWNGYYGCEWRMMRDLRLRNIVNNE